MRWPTSIGLGIRLLVVSGGGLCGGVGRAVLVGESTISLAGTLSVGVWVGWCGVAKGEFCCEGGVMWVGIACVAMAGCCLEVGVSV